MPVESCIPIIPSANLEKSLRLWVDGLGFSMSSEMRKDDKLIFCMLRKENLCFMLNQRAGTPVKPEDYEGIRLYWAPKDILRADRVSPYRRRRLFALLWRPYTEIGISRKQSRTANQKSSARIRFGGNPSKQSSASRLLMNTGSAANDSGTVPCVVSNGTRTRKSF